MKRYVNLAKIRTLRKQKGLTQEDMAHALGYETAIGYHYLETGKRRIKAEKLADIAGILGVSIEELVGQLSTRKYRITSKGRIALESKSDMKKRGLRSPDRADAVVLAFAPSKSLDPGLTGLLRGAKLYG